MACPMAEMRAPTVRQPHAGFIAHLDKRRTGRGDSLIATRATRIAIHAAATVDRDVISALMGAEAWASLYEPEPRGTGPLVALSIQTKTR